MFQTLFLFELKRNGIQKYNLAKSFHKAACFLESSKINKKKDKNLQKDKSDSSDDVGKSASSYNVNTNEDSLQKKILESGVTVIDLKLGTGTIAKSGKQIQVYYTGYLKENNKIFDSMTKGKGFKFNLGRGEVIKGWDIGVPGMKVGGKRVVTCPPNAAYGSKGVPPTIPPNSTLVFEIELNAVT